MPPGVLHHHPTTCLAYGCLATPARRSKIMRATEGSTDEDDDDDDMTRRSADASGLFFFDRDIQEAVGKSGGCNALSRAFALTPLGHLWPLPINNDLLGPLPGPWVLSEIIFLLPARSLTCARIPPFRDRDPLYPRQTVPIPERLMVSFSLTLPHAQAAPRPGRQRPAYIPLRCARRDPRCWRPSGPSQATMRPSGSAPHSRRRRSAPPRGRP